MATGRFITWVLVCVFAVCGCVAAPSEGLRGEPAAPATAQQRADAALALATAEWSAAVGWSPAVNQVRFEVPASDADRVAAMWDQQSLTLILVPERLGDDQRHWDAVVMHELGHAYGAEHVADASAVMYAQPGAQACIREADAAELRRVLQVDVSATCLR